MSPGWLDDSLSGVSRSSLVHRSLLVLAGALGACAGQSAAVAEPATPATRPGVAFASGRSDPLAAVGDSNAERVKKRWEAAAGGRGRAVAIERRRGRVAYSNGNEVLVYALSTGKRLPAIVGACHDVIRGGLAYAGQHLVIVCENGARIVRNASASELSIAPSKVTAAAFTEDRMALGHHDGVVRIYPFSGGEPIEIPVPGPPIDVKSLALAPDGARVAVAWIQGSIWWWEVEQPDAPHKLVRHESESDALAFSGDGTLLAEEGESLTTTVWSFAGEPRETDKVKNGAWVKRIHFTRDSKWLVRGGSDGLELAEIAGPRRVALGTRGAVEDVALDDEGHTIAAVDRDGRLTVWAP